MGKYLVSSLVEPVSTWHHSRPRLSLNLQSSSSVERAPNSIRRMRTWHSVSTHSSAENTIDRRTWLVSLVLLQQQQQRVARARGIDYVATSAEDLAELVDAVPDGSVITLQSKEYALKDTLRIEKPLTLRGSGASASRLSISTRDPYISVLSSHGSGPIHLQGFSVIHSSPSVANNYAVYLVDANEVSLEALDIQSETGTGIAIEGGKVLVKDCVIHDCASNGIGIFSNIVGDDASNTVIQGTRIVRNGRNGVLIKGAGSPLLESNLVQYNREHGIVIEDSEPRITRSTNVLSSNNMGPMTLDSLSRVLDTL